MLQSILFFYANEFLNIRSTGSGGEKFRFTSVKLFDSRVVMMAVQTIYQVPLFVNSTWSSFELLTRIGRDYIAALGKRKHTSFATGYLGSSAPKRFLWICEFTYLLLLTHKCSFNGVFWQDFVRILISKTLVREVVLLIFVNYNIIS